MHQSLPTARLVAAARPRLSPIGAVACQRALVAVVRQQPALPSLEAGRVTAGLRARGHSVRVAEFEGRGILALPRVGSDADLVVLVDADEQVRTFPADLALDPAEGDGGVALVPDFSDYPHARTRVLPIAAAHRAGMRPLGALLPEVREYMRRYASPDLVFIDRALNDDPMLLEGLVGSIQRHAHGVQWMAAVEVRCGPSDGLSRRLVRAAAVAGLRSLVLRADGADATHRAQELASHAADAGILTRVVVPEPGIEIQRRNLIAALRGGGNHAFADIALKD